MIEPAKVDDTKLKSTLNEIKGDLDSLEEFLEANDSKCERFKRHLKNICDYLKIEGFDSTLPELIVDRECVDLEQIYQQMQLFNASDSASISALTKFFSKTLLNLNSLSFGIDTSGAANAATSSKSSSATVSNNEETDADVEESESEESAAEEYSDEGEENGDENGEEEEEEEDEEDEELKGEFDDDDEEEDEEGGLFGKGDIDEEAFKAEMNNFDDDDEDEDEENEDDENGLGFNGKGGDEEDEDEEDEAERIEAEMATPNQKLKDKIDEIHETMLNDFENKPWQLKGEVSAKSRPQDSLMEEFVEFDHTTRQAPIIDSTFTERIEKLIKQRIKDKSFDDVERKVRPVEMHYEFKKQVVLDSEKSKVGLGQIYEQEFLKQQQKQIDAASQQSNETSNKETLANPKHEEIRKRLQSLFIKLDALSNFHFTPKAPTPEMKVVSNMPTINMEEVAPVNVADSNILAPEEIRGRINALPKSKTEEDKHDKNRKLRNKKLISRKKKHEREKKLEIAHAVDPDNPVISKEVAMNKLKKQAKNMSKNIKILKNDKKDKKNKTYSSSSAFFKQLQENNEVKKNGVSKKKKLDSNEQNKKSSKKLKL